MKNKTDLRTDVKKGTYLTKIFFGKSFPLKISGFIFLLYTYYAFLNWGLDSIEFIIISFMAISCYAILVIAYHVAKGGHFDEHN